MRLDHLLSKELSRGYFIVEGSMIPKKVSTLLLILSGDDAIRGNTRPHLEHDG